MNSRPGVGEVAAASREVAPKHQDLDAPQSHKVLAHELAHVVQQARGGSRAGGPGHEHEAWRAADRVSRGLRVGPLSPARRGVQADEEQPTPLPRAAAPPARAALTRPTTDPVHVPLKRRMWFRSSMFANNEAYLRQMLVGHMAVSGTEATRRLVREFVRTRGREEEPGGVRIIGLPAHTYGARRGSMVH